MMIKRPQANRSPGIVQSVLVAYLVLLLHLVLLAGLGVLVIFLRGMVHYLGLIFIGGSLAILASAFYLYKRLQVEGRRLGPLVRPSLAGGRAIEVSLLSGMLTFRFGRSDRAETPVIPLPARPQRLADTRTFRAGELTELSRLLEKGLITRGEFMTAKDELFDTAAAPSKTEEARARSGRLEPSERPVRRTLHDTAPAAGRRKGKQQ